MDNLIINGVVLLPFIFGLVEFFKNLFDLEGKAVTALSMGVGVGAGVLFQAYQLIPDPYQVWVGYAVFGVATGLTASGFYKFATRNE